MVIVKTVDEFKKKNEGELRAFMTHKTGIYDQEMINDTLQEFYTRLIQSKALENFDENRAPTDKENKLNYEKWVCNNFCWLLPMLRKKNYRDVLRIKVSKRTSEKRESWSKEESTGDENQQDYETLKFYSTFNTEKSSAGATRDIFEVVNPSAQSVAFSINEKYKVSLIEQEANDKLEKAMNSFFRYLRRTVSSKKALQTESYMTYRMRGLNSVDIAILLGVSNNMVKFIKRDSRDLYTKWLKKQTTP